MKRRKASAAPAPTNAAEATLMIGEFVQIERDKALERLAAEAAIDRIKQQRDECLRDLEAQAQPLFAGLKAWWEAGGKDELAKGKRSAEIGGAKIGIRLTPPAVKFKRGVKIGDVVNWLRSLRFVRAKDFLRTKIDLDRQAVIKAVQADAALAQMFAAHLSVEQADEFFIDTGLDDDDLRSEVAAG
ncbi:MAG: host-nuclease inhibitor Gam family protein [Erythrobacter sp.]|nr:host-nuclease inhibitor Gam family protein [Erythrobacter sp.]MDZ4272941.1 host-nuclease inhibitor Gam family protein [Erythrobacter sp.]